MSAADDFTPYDPDDDPYTPEELAYFARVDADQAAREESESTRALVDDLLEQRGGLSAEDLVRWALVRPDEDVQGILERVTAARPRVAALARFGKARHALDVAEAVYRLRVRDEADRQHRRESLTTAEPPEPVSLTALLNEPEEDVLYRVQGLWPTEGRVVLAAQNKSGKTTLTGNLIRSLADGDDFLARFPVSPVDRVVLVDDEMSRSQTRRWLRDQGIRKTDAATVFSLKGRLSSFNILDPEVRQEWVERIGPADVLIFDCLRPALDSLGLSEDKDAGRFLVALDELVAACGIGELLVVHHMGHSNERSRGDSRLEDWPDAKWKLVKEDPGDPESPRYFYAFGRDVDQGEVRLHFEPSTRHLSIDGGSRRQATASRIEDDIVLYIAGSPGCGTNEIRDAVNGDDAEKRRVLRSLVANGVVEMRKIGQKHTHYLADDATSFCENVEN